VGERILARSAAAAVAEPESESATASATGDRISAGAACDSGKWPVSGFAGRQLLLRPGLLGVAWSGCVGAQGGGRGRARRGGGGGRAGYAWPPAGYVFCDGYWDYPLAHRGVLFAPVVFARPIYTRPAYVYTPVYVVSEPCMVGALFVRRGHSHYYFGDY